MVPAEDTKGTDRAYRKILRNLKEDVKSRGIVRQQCYYLDNILCHVNMKTTDNNTICIHMNLFASQTPPTPPPFPKGSVKAYSKKFLIIYKVSQKVRTMLNAK
ncbi:hypothetical protein PoB_005490000 [Plakobranchus ocellatus]|uniref:Uncharacterized protein n=1 Tax=Plakobranchus ocellatus TaxID=259542 RepID=A0AAV4CAF6_9GAST|nr:hypothetical protein PoB_005490000 [Plakobranchus ocellatus]